MLKIGLIGYGKAGQAVANVLGADPSLKLEWIAKRTNLGTDRVSSDGATPVIGLDSISGTARKIAEALDVEDESITSLRLGGIVGHHEVVFGFPYQTVRISHDSIRREAFGTGAVFALRELATQTEPGYYTFEELLMQRMRSQWLHAGTAPSRSA